MLVDNVIQGFQKFYGNGENTPWVFLMVLVVAFFLRALSLLPVLLFP